MLFKAISMPYLILEPWARDYQIAHFQRDAGRQSTEKDLIPTAACRS